MNEKILKIAYKMPPQENWNRFRDENQSNPNFINEEHYKNIVDAGFTHGMGLLEHGSDIAERALAVAEKVGLKYYVRDAINWANILHPDYYYYNSENYKKYQKYSSFAGVYLCDEPNSNKYDDLAKMVKGYFGFFEKGEPLVNLLPTYANCVEQLGEPSYEDYIENFAKKVPLDYIMYDHYPFRVKNKTEDYRTDDFLYNCSVVAKACKKYGKKLRTFIQSSVVDLGKTEFLPKMLDYQIHVHLAFGSTALLYYFYWGDEEDNTRSGIVDWNGNPTALYYGAKEIHQKISNYESLLLACKWQKGEFVKGKKQTYTKEDLSKVDIHGGEIVTCEYDGVLGVFDYQGENAFYLVNYTEPKLNLSNVFKINLQTEYTAWVNGVETQLKKGENEIVLPSCAGAFLIPKKD